MNFWQHRKTKPKPNILRFDFTILRQSIFADHKNGSAIYWSHSTTCILNHTSPMNACSPSVRSVVFAFQSLSRKWTVFKLRSDLHMKLIEIDTLETDSEQQCSLFRLDKLSFGFSSVLCIFYFIVRKVAQSAQVQLIRCSSMLCRIVAQFAPNNSVVMSERKHHIKKEIDVISLVLPRVIDFKCK